METKARKRQKSRVRSMLNYYKNLGYDVDFNVLNLSTQKLAKITSKHIRGESNKWFHTIKETGLQVPIKEWNKFARDLRKAQANAKKYFVKDEIDIKHLTTKTMKGFKKLAEWTEKRSNEKFFSEKDRILLQNFKYMLNVATDVSPEYIYLKETLLQKGNDWILSVLKANIKDVNLVLFFYGYSEYTLISRNMDQIFRVFGLDSKLENEEVTLYNKKHELKQLKHDKFNTKKFKNVSKEHENKYIKFKNEVANKEKDIKDYYRKMKEKLDMKDIKEKRDKKMKEKYNEAQKKLKEKIK